jgi:hypothetical protein
MKISEVYPKTWADRQRDADDAAKAKATAPSVDARTGETIPHCTGRQHKWNPLRHPLVLICDLCGAPKMRDR